MYALALTSCCHRIPGVVEFMENTNNFLSVLNTGTSVKVIVDSKSVSLNSNIRPPHISHLCLHIHSGRDN